MSRLQSLDVMRGITVAAMVLVNTPGSWQYVYWPLEHAQWNGLTPTDCVFPFFLFIVGAAVYLAQGKLLEVSGNSQPGRQLIAKIIKRSLLIFAVGVFLNVYPFNKPLDSIRVMGVLQRIAIVYAVVAFSHLYFTRTQRRGLIGLLLISYWFVFALFGGDMPYNINNSLTVKVDEFILGASHLWQGKGMPFDPEGLLSSIPACASGLLGADITQSLIDKRDRREGAKYIAVVGVMLVGLGLLSSLVMPINKSLWTSSYVLLTSGIASLCLALIVDIVDIRQWHRAAVPFLAFGMNPLFIYVLAELWSATYDAVTITLGNTEQITLGEFIFRHYQSILSDYLASLAFALTNVAIAGLVAVFLYRQRVIIKL